MEKRLRNLRGAMKRTALSDVHFSEAHRLKVHDRIAKETEKEEDILLAVLQLTNDEKTGYELVRKLRSRGFKKFEDREGLFYALLHRLEQKGILTSRWKDDEVKVYSLNDSGRKILQKAEQKHAKKRFVLKELLEG